jgi:hypothetical protein
MAVRRTKAEIAKIALEAAEDVGLPPVRKPVARKTKALEAPEPPTAPAGPKAPAYTMADFVGKTNAEGIYSWTATIYLGLDPAVTAVWNGAKRSASLQPLAKTSGAATELKRFESAAKRLLPGRDSITDLVAVLIVTGELNIKPFNRVLLVKDILGSADIAFDPTLIIA